jgi:tetratricopeptide (TPR) repeat protein
LGSETVYNLVSRTPDHQLTLLSIIITAPVVGLFLFYFRFVFGYFIRNFERQADLYALRITGSSRPLINALEKIGYYSGNIRELPSWHHFSIAQRVATLRKGEADPGVITRHDKKLRNHLVWYFVAVVVLGYAGYTLTFSNATRQLNVNVVKKILLRHMEKNPQDIQSLAALSTLQYESGEYEKAEQGYLRILAQDPENVETLNNLAWLYATCREESCRRPQEALKLAQKAVSLVPRDAHVLDTLAESYYANGMLDEAVETINRAIALKPQDMSYYLGQLEKFQKARESDRNQQSNAGRTERGEK